MSTGWIIALAALYIVLSPLAVWYMQGRFRGLILEKLITILSTPGCLFVLFFIAGPLSIPYFWLYRERHRTTIDFDGTDSEKADMEAYRLALRGESFWDRVRYATGFTDASENRRAAEEAIMRTWELYKTRTESARNNMRDDQ
jgi:uncharacterized membrane protein YqaE (UPF0057 family)